MARVSWSYRHLLVIVYRDAGGGVSKLETRAEQGDRPPILRGQEDARTNCGGWEIPFKAMRPPDTAGYSRAETANR